MVGPLSDSQSLVVTVGVIALLVLGVFSPAVIVETTAHQTQPETDNTVTRIDVYENGSAQWTVQVRTRLDTAERVDEYDAFRSRFDANKSRYLNPFRTRIQRVVTNAANATGRQMRAVEFTASTSIQEVPRRWGIVTYEFTWTNFAARTDGNLVVGDVFQGGFFLASNDTLVIAAPDGYEVNRVKPTPASRETGVVSWAGREDFPDRQPQVAFAPRAVDGPTTSTPASPVISPSSPTEGVSPTVLLGGGLLLLLLGAIAYRVSRFRNDRKPTNSQEGQSDDGPSEVVMTDEEMVLRLLEDHDGRVRQTAIADEFDWSASKTSRVIGRMVDEGTIEKLQLGRENLLELVDFEE